jgi:hypothetical protein
MFKLDVPELVMILVIVFFLFGAKHLHEMGQLLRTIDRGHTSTTIREIFTPQFFISLGTILLLFTIAYALM